MKKSPIALSAICLLTLLFISCHKSEKLQTQSTYTFTNQTPERITFDIYASKEDYNQNANRLQQYFIEPGANQKIVFDVLKKYWVDWYSDGYSFNNWRKSYTYDEMRPDPEIQIATENDTYTITGGRRDTARSVLLNGNGTSSIWQGSAANAGVFTGTHRFTFRKDYTGEYSFTDSTGRAATTPITFTLEIYPGDYFDSRSGGFRLSVFSEHNPGAFCYVFCSPTFASFAGRDILMASLTNPQPGYSLNIIRQ